MKSPARVCGDGGRCVDLIWKTSRRLRASARRESISKYEAGPAFEIAGNVAVIDDYHCADSRERDQDSQQEFGEEVEEAMKGSQQKIHKEPIANCGQLERGLIKTTSREQRRGRLR